MVNGKQTDASSSLTDSVAVSTYCNYISLNNRVISFHILVDRKLHNLTCGASYINLVLSLQEKVHGRTIAVSCGHVYL